MALDFKQQRGQIIIFSIVFMAIMLTMSAALVGYTTLQIKGARKTVDSAVALQLAEAAVDKAVYELNQNINYTGETNVALGGGTFSIVVASIDSSTKTVTATGYVPNSQRTVKTKVSTNPAGITFRYGTETGQGGIIFSNNAYLTGNLYANGNLVGANGAYITGEAWVAGSSGSIATMCIGGVVSHGACSSSTGPADAHAHTVTSSSVTGTIYCQSGSGNNTACNTTQADPDTQSMPITDADIAKWKNDAAAGTPINGDYSISTGSATLGPTKIIGNLTISGTAVVTLANTVWVTGTITFSGTGNGSKLKLATGFGSQSGILMSDSLISVGNNVAFEDSGTNGSYIMLLTTSSCDESVIASPCNSKNAIEISNNAAIVIANAQQGTVNFSNNATVKEVVGKTIRLKNNVGVQYGSGLPNTLFQSGTGGAWAYQSGTYSIVD